MHPIATVRRLLSRKRSPHIRVVLGDITKNDADAIVNAAKSTLLGGSGVDGAIHTAGGPAILAACRALRATTLPDGLLPGAAVATTAGRLNALRVIHTVGPVYSALARNHATRAAQLRSCYTSALAIADKARDETVAFPLISAGVYGWPVRDAIVQALKAISSTRLRHVKTVRLVLFDEDTFRTAQRVYDHDGYWLL